MEAAAASVELEHAHGSAVHTSEETIFNTGWKPPLVLVVATMTSKSVLKIARLK